MKDPIELDDVARRIIAEGRRAFEPSPLVTARVRRLVEDKLVEGAVSSAWQGRRPQGWLKFLVGAAAASVATAAWAYAVWHPKTVAPAEPARPSTPVVALVSRGPMPQPQEPVIVSAPATATSQTAPTRTVPASLSKSEKSESLAEEVKLLASVNFAIQSHDGNQALRLLRAYDRQFKKPQLIEERAAASVLALCASGQVEAARAAAKRFQSNFSRSPLTARVLDSCIASK
jgi:hypothetical protein